jgi:hypothetical protein
LVGGSHAGTTTRGWGGFPALPPRHKSIKKANMTKQDSLVNILEERLTDARQKGLRSFSYGFALEREATDLVYMAQRRGLRASIISCEDVCKTYTVTISW